MTTTALRKLAVLLAVVFAIAVPALQAWLHLGLSAAAFGRDGDQTLRAAPYAFAIWGVIYLAMAAYAVFQLRARNSATLTAFGWPSAVAAASCGGWILASALDAKAATIVIILVGAAAATTPLLRGPKQMPAIERLLVVWPIALLAGWLTVASALNLLTVLTAWRIIAPPAAALWAAGAILLVGLIAWRVVLKANCVVYLVPLIWGLIGVYMAERLEKPLTAGLAAIAAAALALVAVTVLVRRLRARGP